MGKSPARLAAWGPLEIAARLNADAARHLQASEYEAALAALRRVDALLDGQGPPCGPTAPLSSPGASGGGGGSLPRR